MDGDNGRPVVAVLPGVELIHQVGGDAIRLEPRRQTLGEIGCYLNFGQTVFANSAAVVAAVTGDDTDAERSMPLGNSLCDG